MGYQMKKFRYFVSFMIWGNTIEHGNHEAKLSKPITDIDGIKNLQCSIARDYGLPLESVTIMGFQRFEDHQDFDSLICGRCSLQLLREGESPKEFVSQKLTFRVREGVSSVICPACRADVPLSKLEQIEK